VTSCIFDRIVRGDIPAHLVVDEERVVAFLDHRPVFPGHTLVVPRVHVATLAELDGGDLGPVLFATARRIAAAQRVGLGAEGTFVGLNDVVSQSVPHVHIHVIPRRFGDGLRGFFWPRGRYASDHEAEAVAAALRAAMNEADDRR
jgi:histidine triad (HIT) family protein